MGLTSIEICAGAGGQALGLEQANFEHAVLVENDPYPCATLRHNRPDWTVIEDRVENFEASSWRGIDLLAGGVPCPPFSKAGKQLGSSDARDLFPEALRLVEECEPRAVMLENVRGLLDSRFDSYREVIRSRLRQLGYESEWRLLSASDFGVPQLRPRAILVALRDDAMQFFQWPDPIADPAPTVGEALLGQMSSNGWRDARSWAKCADRIAPTLVGGSKKHGGPDLGPTRARQQWKDLGVNGATLADEPPDRSFRGMPRLTVQMTAILQGFPPPPDWEIVGGKTAAYRQVGNAFPPPVAKAVGKAIASALAAAGRPIEHVAA